MGSNLRICWDVMSAALLFYDLAMIPLIAFNPPDTDFTRSMDLITSCFWTFDIAMSVSTGIVQGGAVVLERRKIAKNYMRTWLGLDIAVVVPDWVFTILSMAGLSGSEGSSAGLLRALRIMRISRLLRLAKLQRLFGMLQDRIDSELTFICVTIIKLLLLIFVLNHLVASVWYLIGDSIRKEGHVNWIDTIPGPMSLDNHYTTAVHWSLCMFTPGAMDIQPQNSHERSFAIIVLLFGLVIFSSFLSSITAAVAQLKAKNADHSNDSWMLRRYLRQRNVESSLTFRILRHVEYVLQKEGRNVVAANKVWALTLLSPNLLSELTYEVQFSCLSVHPLLWHMTSLSAAAMKQELARLALSQRSLAATDVLYEMGTSATHMHIIIGGSLVYTSQGALFDLGENSPDIRLRSDDWLCEPVMWTAWFHRGNATAQSEVELVSIDAISFIKALQGHTVHGEVQHYAENYIQMLSSIPRKRLTDVNTLSVDDLAGFLYDGDQVRTGPRRAFRGPASRASVR